MRRWRGEVSAETEGLVHPGQRKTVGTERQGEASPGRTGGLLGVKGGGDQVGRFAGLGPEWLTGGQLFA